MEYKGKSPLFNRALVIVLILSVFFCLFAFGCVAVLYSDNMLNENLVRSCVGFCLGAVVCAVAIFRMVYDSDRCFSIVTMNKLGITSKCMFHDDVFLPWDEISDCGICIEREAATNEFKMLYVADSELYNRVKLGQRSRTRRVLPSRFLLIKCDKSAIELIVDFANKDIAEKLTQDLKYYKIEH